MNAKASNAGRALALCMVDEMARCGVRHACLSPGSRSTPMALALAEHEDIALHVLIDERSASFAALGIAKQSRGPVAVLTTSGTAAANCLPAVIEAHHSAVPLLMLTADRPPELRDTGAGQTIDQIKLYGDCARWFVEVGVAEAREASVAYWRSVASRACNTAGGPFPGPVHLNLAFRDPLTDAPDETGFPFPLEGRPGGRPWTTAVFPRPLPGEQVLDELAGEIAKASRGLLVAGTGDYDPAAVSKFAEAAGWPLLAEATSNARFGANAISSYDAILRSSEEEFRPGMVVIAGSPGLSKQLPALLDASVPQIRIDPYAMWHDAGRSASRFIQADPAALLEQVAKRLPDKTQDRWLGRWLSAEQAARAAIDSVLDGWEQPSEPATARDLAACLPGGSNLVVASSMPVRDLDWFMAPRQDIRVMANRGANGIDGFVSTILGVALSSDRFTCGLLGDLALLHDQNGLLMASSEDVHACLVVVNNDGGGIFSFLPQAVDERHFERLFGTPHGRDLEKLAAFYGCAYRKIGSAADLRPAIAESHRSGGVTLVEVPTDRASNVRAHREIWDAVSDAGLA